MTASRLFELIIALLYLAGSISYPLGLVLRRIMGGWASGFARLEAEGSTPATEAIFRDSLRRARPIVWVFWTTSALMAFAGLLKPF